ncbi:MAG: M3 family metallopeptidase [Burkholderiaceae bacterium]|nr:M3 family metallopeptidase [Burkholderiaceae bacterium]
MDMRVNPLLQPWSAPHGLPPFDAVEPEHFVPAFEHAMAEHRRELDAIAASAEPPTAANTLAAFDAAGLALARLDHLFHNLTASHTSPALQQVQRELAPRLAAHENAVFTHRGVYERLAALHARRDALGLDAETLRLLERVHLDFVRAGATLAPEAQKRHAHLVERMATLMTQFAQNVLADESQWWLELRDEADLAGLPDAVRAAARQAAADRGLDGAHVITLSRSLVVPFLTSSDRRDLRERAWRAWADRGERGGATDNRAIVRELLQLRAEQAALHGYATFADYALADTMARDQAAVRRLLDDVWRRALDALAREREALEALRREAGDTGTLEPWDWRWWAEKARQRRFAVDDAEVKPYFALERMVAAAFDCAQRLFGLRFVERPDLPVYHPDVKAYEVFDAAGAVIGVFLHDNFARPSKRSGAWMSVLREQSRALGAKPIVLNNNNFAKAAPGEPVLLGFDDVRTLFHEFGHGLHGLLSNVTYRRLAGTNVLRDFVELPSQLFEHWATERDVLRRHARHVRTGEPIPDALIDRLHAARRFGQAYETARYTASAIVDLEAHALPAGRTPDDVVAFEREVLERLGAPAAAGMNHRLVHFQHLFSGSWYAAGYYVYLWAEVLDADAFDAFVEAGDPFDAATAERLRRHVYAAGDSVEPGATYAAFRGRAPALEPMLRKKGLLAEA